MQLSWLRARPTGFRRFRIKKNTPSDSSVSESSVSPFPMISGKVPVFPSWKQLQLFPQTLSNLEKQILNLALVIIIAALSVLGVGWYQEHSEYVPRSGGQYTEAVIGEPKYVNPILAYGNDVDLDLTHLLFPGLYRINEQGAVDRDLAAHEEISEDGKTYIITIQQSGLWHDGTPITAQDVAFTFDRIKDPESQSPYWSSFKDVTVELVNDYTVKMTLEKPYAPFLSTLTVGMLPQHIWGEIPASSTDLAEFNIKPIGAGPFAFESLTKDRRGIIKSYHFVRFDEYYGEQPYLDELTFRFYPTKEEMMDAVKHNKADGLSFVTSEMREELERQNMTLHELQLPQYTAVFFNQRNPLLKEKVIRQTLERAISKDTILQEALGGAGQVIHTPILPGFLGHNPAVLGLAYNADDAKKALDDAGWALLEGEAVRKKDGRELRFALSTVDRPEYVKTAELLKDYWHAIGVEVELRIYSSNDIVKRVIKPRDYEALLFGEIVGTDPDPYPFWHSSQSFDPGLNLAIFFNKDVDQLLEEARQINDEEQRRLKYLHFQNILSEEQPAIFLYNPYYTYALPKRMKGFSLEKISVPSDRFNGIEHWHIKTNHVWK